MSFLGSCRVILNSFIISKTSTLVKKFDRNFKFYKTNLQNSTRKLSMDKFVVLSSPVKSASDKKEYKVIQLKNGMTACLISDTSTAILVDLNASQAIEEDSSESSYEESSEESEDFSENEEEGSRRKNKITEHKMAAAGLCVGVGSFSDPKEVPGMAHFLEHMVFMGSEKFPEENDFDSFIKKGGGSNNASTDTETTCFYFECLDEHMPVGLDKFAQFFITPLMKKGAMTRERQAIESEFQMAVPSDSSKREQLLFSFAKPESPVNSFTWGNLITLRDNISDSKLYKGVHAFRKQHYSAHRMTLAIQARLPIDTLQELVLKCFENVPNNGLPPLDFSKFEGNVFDTPEFRRMYYVKPTKDLCQVDLTWSLPPLFDQYKCNPLRYLSHLLGDEGTGSITAYLRKKLWAITVTSGNSGSGDEYNSMYALFTVTIVLTDEGMNHLFEVIETVFSYLHLLQSIGPQERIYNELQNISDIAFKFSTEQTSVDTVEDLCERMQYYPPIDYLTSDELLYQYNPEVITKITNLLTPDKMNIMVMTSKDLPDGIQYNKKEQWFGTKYVGVDISDNWLKRWKETSIDPDLAIPKPNPYLTQDFSILPVSENHPKYPENIINSPELEVWYRQDQKFKFPLGYYYFYLISPLAMKSAKNSVLLDLMMNILTFALAEKLYPATNANLYYSVLTYEKGLSIKVYGYNEKLPLIIEVISQHLLHLNSHFNISIFNAIKDKLSKNYYNKLLKPSNLAKDIRLQLLVDKYWPPAEKFLALQETTFEDMKTFIKEYLDRLYMKVLVQGNVSQETATLTVNKFVKSLNYNTLARECYPKFRVVQVPVGEKCLRIDGFNKNDKNSIITNYYQCGPFSIENSVIIDIILLIIEEPLFDILRTKQQLGYHIYCTLRDTFGILGYTITVTTQATKFSTQHVDNRIEDFLKHSQTLLINTSEKELEDIKEDLIKTKQCVDIHLEEEVERNWSEIINDDYIFDRHLKEIETIKKTTIEEIRKWWDNHNQFGTRGNFRKISFQVVGHDNQDTSAVINDTSSVEIFTTLLGDEEMRKKEKKDKEYFILSIQDFKNNAFLYPPVNRNN